MLLDLQELALHFAFRNFNLTIYPSERLTNTRIHDLPFFPFTNKRSLIENQRKEIVKMGLKEKLKVYRQKQILLRRNPPTKLWSQEGKGNPPPAH